MATRSTIALEYADGTVGQIYCHWDGYLEHNGKILQEHYDSAKANNLVALGDISSLGTKIGEVHPFSPYDSKEDKVAYEAAQEAGWTTFYGRDRGETGVEFTCHSDFTSFLEQCDSGGVEYYYIMRDGVWYCGTTYESDAKLGSRLVPLAEALADHDIEHSEEMTAA